jgi:hypothetical protein
LGDFSAHWASFGSSFRSLRKNKVAQRFFLHFTVRSFKTWFAVKDLKV